MANAYIEINGRLVQGHPMNYSTVTDPRTGKPQTKADNVTPRDPEAFIAIAVPKSGEQHWNQTVWGHILHEEGLKGWPRGEWQMKDFAWKIVDGDSPELNTRMKRPCDNEGFPGHWIVYAKTSLPIQCFANGKYAQTDMLRDPKMIKTGDYCRVLIYIKPNGSTQSPGMYLNPFGFDMTRAGEEIISGPDAGGMFSQTAPVIPQNAKLDKAVAPPPATTAPPTQPNMGFVAGPQPAGGPPPAAPAPPPNPVIYRTASDGKAYTEEQLRGFGWNDAQIQALPINTGTDIPF